MIVGIDEVGRGAWAGPMVVGAVALNGALIPGLTDSKKLTATKRQTLAKIIKESQASIGLGWVSAATIDKIGLSEALKLAARLALNEIDVEYEQIIIDGTIRLIEDPRVTTLKQADLIVPSVSAASIMAKVARDYYMSSIVAKKYPDYAFDKHVGYGTAKHRYALQEYGSTELHRQSFEPVRKCLGQEIIAHKNPIKVQYTDGYRAEQAAMVYLQKEGYIIIENNWRTKLCEIDIVAEKNNIIHLVEVKYRKESTFGDGVSAITPKKLRQMIFAARVWQHWHNSTKSIQLDVIAVGGKEFTIDKILTNVS